jgi:hypothetical protein
MRPGRAPDGSLLIPLEKMKTGDESPAFAVEVAYVERVPQWSEKGRARLSFLTLDMPISKSSLLLHYSPLFRLTPAPGSFRLAPFEPSASAVLRTAIATPDATENKTGPQEEIVQRLQKSHASRPTRNLPLRIAFPNFGPSIFLVSELTSENQTPVVEMDFQRNKKRGEK